MFKRGLLSAVAAVAVVLGAAGAGQAGVVNWTITGGKFDDGGTLNGTFSIDTSTGAINVYDLITTPGTTSNDFPANLGAGAPTTFGTEYSPNGPNAWFAGLSYTGDPEFMEAVYWAPTGDVFQTMVVLDLPTTHGGSYSLAGVEGLWGDGEFPITDASQNQYVRTLVSGTAVGVGGVPEPATWALLILGLGLVGFAARRRGRGFAAAA